MAGSSSDSEEESPESRRFGIAGRGMFCAMTASPRAEARPRCALRAACSSIRFGIVPWRRSETKR
eukprot:1062034-Rhodomonas_salina.1